MKLVKISYSVISLIHKFVTYIQEAYFINVPKKKPKGMLYQKYHNTITKLKRQDLWEKNAKSNLNSDRLFDKSVENCHLTIETDGNIN